MNGSARRVLVLLMIAAGAAGFIWIGLDFWAGRRVDREFARLEKRYGSLYGRSIVASPVAVEFNSARFVRAAVALTIRPVTASYGTLLTSATNFDRQTAPSPEPADVRAFVDSNRAAIQLALEATTRHQASWDADYAGGSKVPSLLDLRTLGNALAYAAILDIKRGQPEDAAANAAAGLAVAASLRREPALLPQLIRIAVALQQCEAVRSLITRSEPSAAALEVLARALIDSRETDPMRVGLLGEMALINTALWNAERGQATDVLVDSRERPFWFGRVGRPLVRLARLYYLQEMDRLIELQSGPRPHPPFSIRARYASWDWRRLGSSFLPGLERAVDSGDRHNSLVGVTAIAVALRRYRLEGGSYPDDLPALVPRYLTSLPIDPVTGRPPVYARKGAGFTLRAEPISKDTPPSDALEWVVVK